MKKIRIEQVELGYAQEAEALHKNILQKFGYSIPDGCRLRVTLEQADGRKKRRSAAANTWTPEAEPMKIWFEPAPPRATIEGMEVSEPIQISSRSDTIQVTFPQSSGSAAVRVHPAEVELLRALDRAESTPGWNFVSLKKFRDEILPHEDVPSIRSDVERQNVLRTAIDKRLILKGKVQNPKSPQFPVTSIRLNRLMPEVQEVLGLPKKDLDFHPIHIKGESLSATIMRERR